MPPKRKKRNTQHAKLEDSMAAQKRRQEAIPNVQQHLPVSERRHLFSYALPRVLWIGERDEVSAAANVSSKESKARAEEALMAYAMRMQYRSPLSWFREPDVLLSWKHPITSPIEVIVESALAEKTSAEDISSRLVTVETVAILLEHSLLSCMRGTDTCCVAPKDRLLTSAAKLLADSVPDSVCPWSTMEPHFLEFRNEAYDTLSHIRDKDGTVYTSTALRGIMDRRMHFFLVNRKCFAEVPLAWTSSPTFTEEQSHVFDRALTHMRKWGWGVLSGPGGAGKTHMLRHVMDIACSELIESEGDGPDCPRCGNERLKIRCSACGYEREKSGPRSFRACFLGPTNRAVAVLMQATQAASNNSSGIMDMVFGTIHAVTRRRDIPPQDLIVIDESSMLASEHGDLLIRTEAFRKAVWLFVGDHLQLPPVGAGELFRPLQSISSIPALRTNLRAKSSSLAGIVNSIRTGSPQCILHCERFFASHGELWEGIRESRCDLVLCLRNEERIRYNAYCIQSHPCTHPGLKAVDDYRKIVCSGDLCKSTPRSFVPFQGMPVRFQTNVFKPDACRGDLGVIKSVTQKNREWQLAVCVCDSRVVTIVSTYFAIAEFIRPAYATTLHDAQGAQCARVGIVLPPTSHCPLLTLETLYTAASRAQEELIFFTHGCRCHEYIDHLCKSTGARRTPLRILFDTIVPTASLAPPKAMIRAEVAATPTT